MGNATSFNSDSLQERSSSENTSEPEDLWWKPLNYNSNAEPTVQEEHIIEEHCTSDRTNRKEKLTQELDEFRKDLHKKHEQRRQLIVERKQELQELRVQLKMEKIVNEELRSKLEEHDNSAGGVTAKPSTGVSEEKRSKYEELLRENELQRQLIQELKSQLENYDEILTKNKELRVSISDVQAELQSVNAKVADFECERNEYKIHVIALKDVIRVSKDMLNIRESQIEELKQKIAIIEKTLEDKEAPLLSDDLRREYERQLRNIRNLRALYEERERVDRREKQNMQEVIEETKKLLSTEQEKTKEHETRIEELEKDNSKKYDTISCLESRLGLSRAECKELQAEMSVINQLFSQILLSFNSNQDMDLEKLIKILEENHDLLSKIAINEESNEISAALPKTLLDLVNQINAESEAKQIKSRAETAKLETIVEETDTQMQNVQLSSAEEIVENLPKVWRVLIELLSHQSPPSNTIDDDGSTKIMDNICYKSVQTPRGTKSVINVSKTFIRLKDLILEKKSLEKETNRLKHLNGHLETRLQDQEKRLQMVSKELSKTWHVVGKMQRQHQQLHTQEKILRYELAQKRKMLNELKEELEYCREKWVQAREKNTSTEMQWKQLRKEFAARKPLIEASTESGYSDDKSSSEEEEPVSESNVAQETSIKSPTAAVNHENLTSTEHTNASIEKVTILDVVKSALDDILESPSSSNSTKEECSHSVAGGEVTNKTDSVQSNDRDIEQRQDRPTTSSNGDDSKFNIEEMLARREERLQRMEQQGKELVTKVTNTSMKSADIFNKLENLHEIYGETSRSQTQEHEESSVDLTESTAELDDETMEPSTENQQNDEN